MGRDITVGKSQQKMSIDVVNKLITTMIVMLVAPIASYYVAKYVAEEYFEVGDGDASIVGAVSAVAGIQLIMFVYVVMAYYEEDWKDPTTATKTKAKETKDTKDSLEGDEGKKGK